MTCLVRVASQLAFEVVVYEDHTFGFELPEGSKFDANELPIVDAQLVKVRCSRRWCGSTTLPRGGLLVQMLQLPRVRGSFRSFSTFTFHMEVANP